MSDASLRLAVLSSADVDDLRAQEFPDIADSDVVYLNNAGTGPLPVSSLKVMHDWASRRTQPWLVSDDLDVFPALAQVRARCATLIGAGPEEIALTPNTSYGLSLAANALPLQADDVVLILGAEFPSIVYAWQAAARVKGFHLRTLPVAQHRVDQQSLLDALDAPGIKALVISWVSFVSGQRIDLESLGRVCRSRGIVLVIDAMQGVGCAVLDVKACHADIVCVGGHKWLLSPWGTGFTYVRRDLIASMQPPVVGWFVGPSSEDRTRLLDYDLTFFADARRFEVMTLAVQDFVAMGRSVELLLALGPKTIEARNTQLTQRLIEGLATSKHLQVITPVAARARASIVTVALTDATHGAAVASQRLTRAGVIHSLRDNMIRLAPHFYTTDGEIDQAIEACLACAQRI